MPSTRDEAFRSTVTTGIVVKLDMLRRVGNDAAHAADELTLLRAKSALKELHLVLMWLDHHYGDPAGSSPPPFDDALIPPAADGVIKMTRLELESAQADAAAKDTLLADARARDAAARAELDALRAQVADLKAANAIANVDVVDPIAGSEAATRRDLIDVMLGEAGWKLDHPRDREWPVTGIPSKSGSGSVDYVLWGDDGKPLAVVEAKRASKDATEGRQQAQLYADALERDFHQRPLIFYTNGFDHWLWDDRRYAPRRVAGFFTKDQLMLMVQRRSSLKPLGTMSINSEIAGRPYQLRAVRSVTEAFEQKRRRTLLVMATGTGKTRTVISLVDVLQRANWAKRVLFLADRTALVRQAVGAFKAHLPDSSPVNLVTERHTDGRVYVSTYQTVMGLIDAGEDELRRLGPGYFDLIVVDEAHRSIYRRYGEIFEYFDALVVGLTATPRADVDHNTYRMFELDDGVPTDAFELDDAIEGGYLVPPVARAIELGFMQRGIRYADLSDDEREQWDELDWQDGDIPDEVDAAAINRWLFNADTVDKVLEVLMTEGRAVAGGDRLGKTIIFAKSQPHAQFIEERFNANYPEHAGSFARVITHAAGPYAQTLIDEFSSEEASPHIAISVDMLDTGIDIPEVVNLVFFKPVHSQTKYWQMVGRGTRLRPDLYGPGSPKTDFVIFDVCGNIEYFNQDVPELAASGALPIRERLFRQRLRVLGALNAVDSADALRLALADRLHGLVGGMNRQNFLVRKRLRVVERFSDAASWRAVTIADVDAIELAALPSSADIDDDETARRFDVLLTAAQAAVAEGDAVPAEVARPVMAIAAALADQRGVPGVAAQSGLLDALQQPDWWIGVSLAHLEEVRLALRSLVRLIDRRDQAPIFTDFEDALDPARTVTIARVAVGLNRLAFRAKVQGFLDSHADNLALRKLRTGRQLTATDLDELEAILITHGGVDAEQLHRQADEVKGLGKFIRGIVGLDRSAAEAKLASFVSAPGFTVAQHTFIDLVLNHLTMAGYLDPRRLYEDPFNGIAPSGPESLFTDAQITDLVERLRDIERTAEPVATAGR